MKNFKRISSVVLAIVMVFAMMVPAMAADDGKITIDPDTVFVGETYSIYKIFDATLGANDAVSYTIAKDSDWYPVVEAYAGITLTAAAGDDSIMVVSKNADFDVAEFVKELDENKTVTTADKSAIAGEDKVVEFTDLPYGYYFVDTTTGTLCSIDTTTPEVVVEDKHTEPVIEKTVEEAGVYGETSYAQIGDTVDFKIEVTTKAGAEGYIVDDVLSAGLTLDADSIEIKVGDALVAEENYTLTTDVAAGTIKIEFEDAYLATLAADTKIVITYSAELNKLAANTNENTNTATLTYGNQSTVTDKTNTDSFFLDLTKVDGVDKVTQLEGAEFEIYDDEGKKVHLVAVDEDDDDVVDYYRVADSTEGVTDETSEKIVVGTAVIKGLDGNTTYELEEVVAPTGYNILQARVPFTTTEGGVAADITMNVENNAGVELPSTGGIGTTIFYLVGGLMVTGAFVLLMTKKRMGNRA